MQLIHEQPRARSAETRSWRSVATHTHFMRNPEVGVEGAGANLLAWCRRHGVDAVGIGSPWEPMSSEHYRMYENEGRDAYYAGQVALKDIMDRDRIQAVFADLNRCGAGRVHFYLDNESPKGRQGHMWWFGYAYDVPAWHDYDQDRPVQYTESDPAEDLNAITGRPHRRRPAMEIVAHQRRSGALGVWAHPTSWWLDGAGRFVTNIAAECGLHLWIDGYLDGIVVMGYHACHRPYQRLWFHLLDTGAVVPGFAETDYTFGQKTPPGNEVAWKTYLRPSGSLSGDTIRDAARAGNAFMSTGAFLDLRVDGRPMGSIVPTASDQTHRLRLEAYPRPGENVFRRIEFVGPGGRTLAAHDGFSGGTLEYDLQGSSRPHWVVALAYGQDEDPDVAEWRAIRHMAISNPVYLHPSGFALSAQKTECALRTTEGNPYLGGTIEWQSADGDALESGTLHAGTLRKTLPAGARVSIAKAGLPRRWFHVALENPEVRRHLHYLSAGLFREDWPDLRPGEVPAEAFQLESLRAGLDSVELDLDAILSMNDGLARHAACRPTGCLARGE